MKHFVIPIVLSCCVVIVSRKYDCGLPEKGYKSVYTIISNRVAVYSCQPSYEHEHENITRYCQLNGTWSGSPMDCQDAINCGENNYPCQNNGVCHDTNPSLYCKCPDKTYYGPLCENADGNWGDWKLWANCSATCDKGVILRKRFCDNPRPIGKGLWCRGLSLQVISCEQEKCPDGMYQWCGEETDRCGQESGNAFCSIYNNTYRCSCLNGVEEIRDENNQFVRCGDVNECELNAVCHASRATCINTVGSYKCVCNEGFDGDGESCKDMNECKDGTHNCDENAKCINLVPGYRCKCNSGYRSISINGTGFIGECRESRLVLYGNEVGDVRVTTTSLATGEYVTPLIGAAPGIALTDKNGEKMICNSVYATENGVIVVTMLSSHADNSRKPTFRNAQKFVDDTGGFVPEYKHICALVAPFWADAERANQGNMWFQVYNQSTWMSLNSSDLFETLQMHKVTTLWEETFVPNFVVIFTWEKMAPPWPATPDELITYQSVFATDGTHTFVINLYEDGAMSWQPTFDVPNDIPYYPAITGFIIQGLLDSGFNTSQHEASGKFVFSNGSIYQLDQINFDSTFMNGRDVINLTPVVDHGAESRCYNWYLTQGDLSDEILTQAHTCPPSLSYLSYMIGKTWSLSRQKLGTFACYTHQFTSDLGETIECCYSDEGLYGDPLLISGIEGWKNGSGFVILNATSDEQLREVCCGASNLFYYCEMYAQKRPATSDKKYLPPALAIYNGSDVIENFNGTVSTKLVPGDFELFSMSTKDIEVDLIGRFQFDSDGVLQLHGIYINDENETVEILNDDKMTCSFQFVSCGEGVKYFEDFILGATTKDNIFYANKAGLYIDITNNGNGTDLMVSVPQHFLKEPDDVSGLLSETGACLYMNGNRRIEFPCSINTEINPKYNYTIFSEPNPQSNWEHEITVMEMLYSDGKIKDHFSKNNKETDITVEAKLLSNEESYEFSINVSNFDGDLFMNNQKLIQDDEGFITMKLPKKNVNLESTMKLVVKKPEMEDATVIFRHIILCDCKGNQGTCDSLNPISSEGIFKSTCICKDGFTGVRCEEIEKPCRLAHSFDHSVKRCFSDNPCFMGVGCSELKGPIVQRYSEKKYKCKSCPPNVSEGNGETCFHKNRCLLPESDPESHKCENAKCINKPYSYECECLEGFKKPSNNEKHICIDIDECKNELVCDRVNGYCINLPGSFECVCNVGYQLKQKDNNVCIDEDECLTNNGGCDRKCTNTEGSFRCSCELGFELTPNGKNCTVRNECKQFANEVCEHYCTDSAHHTFICSCQHGYYLNEDLRTCTYNNSATTEAVTTTTTEPSTTLATTEPLKTTTQLPTTTIEETTLEHTTADPCQLPDEWKNFPRQGTKTEKRTYKLRKEIYCQFVFNEVFESFNTEELGKTTSVSNFLANIFAVPSLIGGIEYMLAVFRSKVNFDSDVHCMELYQYFTISIESLEIWEKFANIQRYMNQFVYLIDRHKNLKVLELQWTLLVAIHAKDYISPFTSDVYQFTVEPVSLDTVEIRELENAFYEFMDCRNYVIMTQRLVKATTRALTTITQTRKERRDVATVTLQPKKKRRFFTPNPILYFGVIAGACAGAVTVFVFLVIGTYYCFMWRKNRLVVSDKFINQKKRKDREHWPRVVIAEDSFSNTGKAKIPY